MGSGLFHLNVSAAAIDHTTIRLILIPSRIETCRFDQVEERCGTYLSLAIAHFDIATIPDTSTSILIFLIAA